MQSMIDGTFNSQPDGGVFIIRSTAGDYTGPGGTWVDGSEKKEKIQMVNIQPAHDKDMERLINIGKIGTNPVVNIEDVRIIHINDGKTYPTADDEGISADMFEFSDGIAVRRWRVISTDNRPWHNFSRVVVQRYRGNSNAII